MNCSLSVTTSNISSITFLYSYSYILYILNYCLIFQVPFFPQQPFFEINFSPLPVTTSSIYILNHCPYSPIPTTSYILKQLLPSYSLSLFFPFCHSVPSFLCTVSMKINSLFIYARTFLVKFFAN